MGPTQSWQPFQEELVENDAALICLCCYRPLGILEKEGAKETVIGIMWKYFCSKAVQGQGVPWKDGWLRDLGQGT